MCNILLLFCLCGRCRWFEDVAKFCDDSSDRIPFGFILGFYVSLVVGRFWEQLNSLPWPSRMGVFVSSMIHGTDEKGRMIRRTIMRYLTISYILTMRNICPPVRQRFQTFKSITEKGIGHSHIHGFSLCFSLMCACFECLIGLLLIQPSRLPQSNKGYVML